MRRFVKLAIAAGLCQAAAIASAAPGWRLDGDALAPPRDAVDVSIDPRLDPYGTPPAGEGPIREGCGDAPAKAARAAAPGPKAGAACPAAASASARDALEPWLGWGLAIAMALYLSGRLRRTLGRD